MRDGVKLYTMILAPKDAIAAAADPARADALRRDARFAPATTRLAVAVCASRYLDGGLHLRVPGSARPLPVGGRVRDVPRAARRLQQHVHRRDDRRLGHDRLAREERSRQQRQGRGVGHVLPGLADARRAARPASRARGGRAVQPRGGRLEGRRLVPLGSVPLRVRVRLHLRDGVAEGRARQLSRTGRATSTRGCCRRDRPVGARHAPGRAPRDVAAPHGEPELRAGTGATARRTGGSTRPSRGRCRR